MNGFMLLVLVALTGQLSPNGLTMPQSANPVQPAAMLVPTPPPQTDYGWFIDKDNALVFIIQISPEKEAIMKSANQVLESEIPPAVAARIKRVIVRFGNAEIESAKPEEVNRLPLVLGNQLAADLPTGQMRTLEGSDGYSLQNVAGSTQPPPLSPGGLGTSLADAAASLNDKISEAVNDPSSLLAQAQNRSNPGAGFLQEAMGNRAGATASPTYPNSPASPFTMPSAGLPATGMPMSTATTPPSTPAYPNNTPAFPSSTAPANNGTSLGVPGLGTAGVNTGVANPNIASSTNAGGYDPRFGNTNTGIVGQTPQSTAPGGNFTSFQGQPNNASSRGFANQPLGSQPFNAASPWAATGNNSQFPQSAYTGNPASSSPSGYVGYPGNTTTNLPTDPLSMRVTDARANIPSTSLPSSSNTNATNSARRGNWDSRSDGYPYDASADTQVPIGQRSGVENVMPVMFVLSLVVNFYLGMLIRKLLGRYRTLLASVRSQTV